jgi:hypothetical protein
MLDKACNIKGFLQQVCGLLFRINWKNLDEAGLDLFSEVMVLLIDVPSL